MTSDGQPSHPISHLRLDAQGTTCRFDPGIGTMANSSPAATHKRNEKDFHMHRSNEPYTRPSQSSRALTLAALLCAGIAIGAGACTADLDAASSTALELTQAPPIGTCDWSQEYGNASHTGLICPPIVHPAVQQVITYDRDVAARIAMFGFDQINYGAPLTAKDTVGHHHLIVPQITNFGFDAKGVPTDVLSIQDYTLDPTTDQYVADWSLISDWASVDKIFANFGIGPTNGYRMEFTPVIANGSVYVPRGAGQVERVDLATGMHQATIDTVAQIVDPVVGTPLSGDPLTAISNALSTDRDGNVYALINKWDPTPGAPAGTSVFGDPQNQSVLAVISPNDAVRTVLWTDLSAHFGLPAAFTPACLYPFGVDGVEPTGPGSTGPIDACGGQRPSFNAPVAIGDNGNLFVKSNDNNATNEVYVLEIDGKTLTGVAAYSLVHQMGFDDCGVKETFTPGDGSACDVLTAGGTTDLGVSSLVGGGDVLYGPEIETNAVTIDGPLMCVGGYNGGFVGDGQLGALGVGLCYDTLTHQIAAHNEKSFWDETVAVNRHGQFVMDGLGPTNEGVDRQTTGFQTISLGVPVSSTDPLPTGLSRNVISDLADNTYSINDDGNVYKFSPSGAIVDTVRVTTLTGVGLANALLEDSAGHLIVSTLGNLYILGAGVRSQANTSASLSTETSADASADASADIETRVSTELAAQSRSLTARTQALRSLRSPSPPRR